MGKKGGGGGYVDPYAGWEANRDNAKKSAYDYAISQMKNKGLIGNDYSAYNTVNKQTGTKVIHHHKGDPKYNGIHTTSETVPVYSNVSTENLSNNDVNDFMNYLNTSTSALSRGSDLSGLLGTNAFDKWYSNKNTDLIDAAKKELSNKYKNLGTTKWSDSSDDVLLNDILSKQYNSALKSVDAQKARGFLDENGYNSALADLETQKAAGSSQLQSAGQSVLGKYRDALNTKASGFKDDVNDLTYGGDGLDYDNYDQIINELYSGQQGSLNNDLYNATSGLSLFNVNDTVNDAAITQQQQNNQTTDFLNAYDAQQNKKKNQRGLGNSSSF